MIMHWWGGEYGMGFGFGGFFMILFWILIILGVVYLVKTLAGGTSSGKEKIESAEEVLKKRFDRGEISKEEFETAMEVLKKSRE
jgi:putative membrane protein